MPYAKRSWFIVSTNVKTSSVLGTEDGPAPRRAVTEFQLSWAPYTNVQTQLHYNLTAVDSC